MKKISIILLILFVFISLVACEANDDGATPDEEGTTTTSADVELDDTTSTTTDSNEDTSSGETTESREDTSSDETTEDINATYTIKWVDYDGTVLETDTEVRQNTTPTYDGGTPARAPEGDFTFTFDGWTPTVAPATADATYTARYSSVYNGHNGASVTGMQPTLTDDGYVLYGLYPQTRVSDAALIGTLNTLSPSSVNGWYFYEGQYYAKATASVYNNESYTFDDGAQIVNDTEYWFRCEPIKWQILSDDNGAYYLLSTVLLDAKAYYGSYDTRGEGASKIYANDYAQSDIREWLNGEFFGTAFALNNSYVLTTSVDNSAATTDMLQNIYASSTKTDDKVFLPSYADYMNLAYGFTASAEKTASREAKTTDYARAMGAWCNTRNNNNTATQHNGSYWTRSASGEYYYCASVINSGGFISAYAVDGASHAVRPAICIDALVNG